MAITLSASSTLIWPDLSTQSVSGYFLVPGSLDLAGAKWVSYTSPARVNGTTYTNSTGYPLALIITISNDNYNSLYINDALVMHPYHGSNGNFMVNTIIPNGATYKHANGSIVTWLELRN